MSVAAWFRARTRGILLTDYSASADALGIYRIAFAAAYLVVLGIPQVGWIAKVPAAFFNPPRGLARFMPGFPPAWMLDTIDVVLILLFVVLLVGWRTRAVSLAITALTIYGHLFQFSFGKIDHDIIATLTPALFASSWGRAFSLDASREKSDTGADGLATGLLASLLTFGFLTAGLPKLLSWVDFDLSTHGVMSWVMNTERNDRSAFLVPFFRRLENPWAWEALDVAAVAFELGAVVALFVGPRWFRGWCVLAVLFHLLNYLMLNIVFAVYLPVYLAFVDWEPVAQRVRSASTVLSRRSRTLLAGSIGLAGALLAIPASRLDTTLWSLIDGLQSVVSFGKWKAFATLSTAAAIALTLAARSVLNRGGGAEPRATVQAGVRNSSDRSG